MYHMEGLNKKLECVGAQLTECSGMPPESKSLAKINYTLNQITCK